jgi:toxin ParE1/3/4
MSSWFLSAYAKATITDIYVYTHETWGVAQADAYLDGLFSIFELIQVRKELWRPMPPEFEVDGYFTRYGRHVIYWKQFDSGEIGIAAILHTSMLHGDRLLAAFGVLDEENE